MGFANRTASSVRPGASSYWRTLAIASGVLFSVAATGLGAGYFWGRANERAHISAIQDELRAAFSGGVRQHEIWRGLVRFNPAIDKSLGTASRSRNRAARQRVALQSGRHLGRNRSDGAATQGRARASPRRSARGRPRAEKAERLAKRREAREQRRSPGARKRGRRLRGRGVKWHNQNADARDTQKVVRRLESDEPRTKARRKRRAAREQRPQPEARAGKGPPAPRAEAVTWHTGAGKAGRARRERIRHGHPDLERASGSATASHCARGAGEQRGTRLA